MKLDHNSLSKLAAKWMQRPTSANGPGCHISFTEVGGLFGGERADAWGYRWGHGGGSVLVEVKVSRSDFLADTKKPHRNGECLGMGKYRYYMSPEGIINIEDLPGGWGLLWVNSRGHIKLKAGHVLVHQNYNIRHEISLWKHEPNVKLEMDLMSHLLNRLGDPEKMNLKFREVMAERNRLAQKCDSQAEELRDARCTRNRAYFLERKITELESHAEQK